MYVYVYMYVYVCVCGWMDGWMDGWMHGCMDAWMDNSNKGRQSQGCFYKTSEVRVGMPQLVYAPSHLPNICLCVHGVHLRDQPGVQRSTVIEEDVADTDDMWTRTDKIMEEFFASISVHKSIICVCLYV